MELINKINMKKLLFLVLLLCFFTNCSKDSYDIEPTNYDYYYPTDAAVITAKQIGDGSGTLDPKGITIANDKLYICNGDLLEVFDAKTLAYIKTISNYVKENTTIKLTNLTSVCIDNGRIYLGGESRVFVLDENTNLGISTVGNGQWWQTFVGVYGVAVKDGLVFVKEKNNIIKIFETSQITDTSNWNLAPIAKLNTLKGNTEIYSMDVFSGNLVVAGRDAKSYLYYNIAKIKANAANSLITPIQPEIPPFLSTKPVSVFFSTNWAVTTETSGDLNYLRLYSKEDFINKKYTQTLNASDIMGQNPFGNIVSTAQLNDRIFLSDNSNKKIRIIKLNQSTITEQN
jgi:hypothetical protein